MFDIELLRFSPETPSIFIMLVSALFAFFLSSLIALTYDFTTRSIYRRAHFVQALALIGIVAAMIMQAIGESVAIGLGILGALSIIRFRTALNDPRNITFMFASLGAGIACGVVGFGIALTGTLVFCAAAIALRYSPMSEANELIGELRIHVPKENHLQGVIESILSKYCRNFELNRLRFLNTKRVRGIDESGTPTLEEINRENLQEFVYLIRLKGKKTSRELEEGIKTIEGLDSFRLNFQKQPTNL
ncbi:MAG: DUF4956 domain-containing protein [Bacteroidota bacterium]